MADLEAFAADLALDDAGDQRYSWAAPRTGDETRFVFAGLLTSLVLTAVSRAIPGKELRSIDALFLRAVRAADAVELSVRPLHLGGQVSACAVTVEQSGRVCAHAQAVLGPRTEDLVRHGTAAPDVVGVEESVVSFEHHPGESRVVGGLDLTRDDQVLPPAFSVWRRASDLRRLGVLPEALLAFDASAYLTGVALLPHEGMGLAQAHRAFTAAITAAHMVFHEPIDLDDWVLVHNESTYAGGGWAHGHGEVFGSDRSLLVSFSLQGMVRPMAGPRSL